MELIGIVSIIAGTILCILACVIYERKYDYNMTIEEYEDLLMRITEKIDTYTSKENKAISQHRLDEIRAILEDWK